MRHLAKVVLATLLLSGCDVTKSDFPVRSAEVQSEVEELSTSVTIVRLTAANVDAFGTPRKQRSGKTTLPRGGAADYRIGPGDVLDIVVWEHPELTMPAGERRTPQEGGHRVAADGTFFYPYVGKVRAMGRTTAQIREDLSVKLNTYVPDPQIEIRVVDYRSQAVSVTGEVGKPSRQQLSDMSLTLLDAIDAAGGLTETSDPNAVTVRRGGATYHVDLDAFLSDGVASNNPVLQAGDVINVPRKAVEEAYLLGQLVKPATVDLTKDNVTLTQAITRIGGLKEDSADARGIFVFRDTATGINVYQLDASNPTAYVLGTRFQLHPQDLVYVTSSPMHRWNRLISSLLPTFTTARVADQIGTD